uniref:DNA mismatch repair protein MLH1 n=1 Tax=Clastoptera arizonana TaxID=38151 RepID=A0A1B6DT03_9HEMI
MSVQHVIKRLEETVVNRIAAGEVIQRPANALKELLENSLDARSTSIQITLKSGGLKLLQIQDNGTGIRHEDMEIVCERFTTSKLTQFEELSSIATFGFRGEALASISHVAHLTITTKTASEQCAYKASYEDGKLKSIPKACAGNQGTTITVEDLFYNVPTRRKALKSPGEEHGRITDVVSKYAIHNPNVAFTLKKHGENVADIRTNSNSTHIENIRTIFGSKIARELLEINSKDTFLQFEIKGYITNANFSTKKSTLLLFINNRLVDSTAIRKVLDCVYALYLPKGSHPFVYFSLCLNPRNVDVNVHPTKHEVHFLHEEAIIEKIKELVEQKLTGANTSRVFHTQVKLPGVFASDRVSQPALTPGQNLVRTDCNSQKLDKFFAPASITSLSTLNSPSDLDRKEEGRREIKLSSVLALRKEVERDGHLGLRAILSNMTFIGCIDLDKALIQHSTTLYICNSAKLMEEMFYQIMLYEFGNFGVIKFKEPLPLMELCKLGLECPESEWTTKDGPKEILATEAANLLLNKAAMIRDYFSIDISEMGNLVTIPLLLVNYVPDMSHLPLYILHLACSVDWENEQTCFQGICRETAQFYSKLPFIASVSN